MKRGGAVYIMTNKYNTVLYTGVTTNLRKRLYEHKNKIRHECFTAKYNLTILVYYEVHQRIEEAIYREKQIKAGSRRKKELLINAINPSWKDLADEIFNE